MAHPTDIFVAAKILGLERAALDRWGRGDPDGFLDLSAPDVVYFDPFVARRIDGLDGLAGWYAKLRGKIRIERDELLNPHVQVVGDAAVLTFQFISWGTEGSLRWNCTKVYRRAGDTWKIIQTHWSLTKAG